MRKIISDPPTREVGKPLGLAQHSWLAYTLFKIRTFFIRTSSLRLVQSFKNMLRTYDKVKIYSKYYSSFFF